MRRFALGLLLAAVVLFVLLRVLIRVEVALEEQAPRPTLSVFIAPDPGARPTPTRYVPPTPCPGFDVHAPIPFGCPETGNTLPR